MAGESIRQRGAGIGGNRTHSIARTEGLDQRPTSHWEGHRRTLWDWDTSELKRYDPPTGSSARYICPSTSFHSFGGWKAWISFIANLALTSKVAKFPRGFTSCQSTSQWTQDYVHSQFLDTILFYPEGISLILQQCLYWVRAPGKFPTALG